MRNYLKTLNMELTTIARACGKQNVHHLEREDLVALTVEAAAMAACRWPAPTGFPAKGRKRGQIGDRFIYSLRRNAPTGSSPSVNK